jgi:hypothetical protein
MAASLILVTAVAATARLRGVCALCGRLRRLQQLNNDTHHVHYSVLHLTQWLAGRAPNLTADTTAACVCGSVSRRTNFTHPCSSRQHSASGGLGAAWVVGGREGG